MDLQKEDRICALCQWNKNVDNYFFCSNFKQKNAQLKEATNYNDTCELFEERADRKNLYD